MKKLTMLVAGGVGYVLGTRAGKERYADIKNKATQLWNDPRVQEKAGHAQDLVKDKVPPKMQEKVADVASKAGQSTQGSGQSSEQGSSFSNQGGSGGSSSTGSGSGSGSTGGSSSTGGSGSTGSTGGSGSAGGSGSTGGSGTGSSFGSTASTSSSFGSSALDSDDIPSPAEMPEKSAWADETDSQGPGTHA